jgi:hypothetical protein
MKTVYEFIVTTEREVEETTTKQEGDKIVTETVKVKKRVPTWFAFKQPSRMEKELAEEERAAWWSRYVEKGILPEALLLKRYADYGGILSEEDRKYYQNLRSEMILTQQEWRELYINDKTNEVRKRELADKLADIQERLVQFEQEQDVFFSNTAEAKARAKLIEWLVMHLSYVKYDENKEWEPYFKGIVTEEKIKSYDKLVDAQDGILAKSYPILSFVATIYSSSQGGLNKELLDEFLKSEEAGITA